MNFDLPSTGTEQPPAFATAVACQDWLATVPMANPVQAQSMLLRQLNLLHRYSLAAEERFRILEVLRAPLADVQEDAAKKYAGKPLPLAPHEQAALTTSLNLWLELTLGYLRCLGECCAAEQRPWPAGTGGSQKACRLGARSPHPECGARP